MRGCSSLSRKQYQIGFQTNKTVRLYINIDMNIMEQKEFNIKEELKKLPTCPGVYLMYNDVNEIIYVGKAINLKNRVRQYFQKGHNRSKKIEQMIHAIDHFEYRTVDTELEALMLESDLIKKYRPRYNSQLRDDENHPYIKISISDFYPKLSVDTGNFRDPNAMYIGPFFKSMEPEQAVELVSRLCKLRTCNQIFAKDEAAPKFDGKTCLNYSMGYCPGCCKGTADQTAYRQQVEKAIGFLKGQNTALILEELQQKMTEAVNDLAFEKAGRNSKNNRECKRNFGKN